LRIADFLKIGKKHPIFGGWVLGVEIRVGNTYNWLISRGKGGADAL
jgi:hypothetical protein